jgi:hypothetical protein
MIAMPLVLADVPPGPPEFLVDLLWLLPVAGLLFGLWLGAKARARREAGARPPSGEKDPQP